MDARVRVAGGGAPREVLLGMVRTEDLDLGSTEALARAGRNWGATGAARPARRPAAARLAEHRVGRVLARVMIAHCAGCEPRAVRLRVSTFGRPEIVAPQSARELRFSVAHSDGLVLCAVTRGAAIGADVESLGAAGPDPLAVAKVVCSGSERAVLRRAAPERRAEHLIAMWTIKEALAKAVGLGASLPFDSIWIAPRSDGTAAVRWRRDALEERSLWSLALLRPDDGHLAAIAVRIEGDAAVPPPA